MENDPRLKWDTLWDPLLGAVLKVLLGQPRGWMAVLTSDRATESSLAPKSEMLPSCLPFKASVLIAVTMTLSS